MLGVKDDKLIAPFRFGLVSPGIYRGSYPTLRNLRFLLRLRLITIISLTPEPPNQDLIDFSFASNIELIHVPVSQTALNSVLIQQLLPLVQSAMKADKHPIYIHCIDGRRISGLFTFILRKYQGWTLLPNLVEYWSFCTHERIPLPAQDIEKQSKELEKLINEVGSDNIDSI